MTARHGPHPAETWPRPPPAALTSLAHRSGGHLLLISRILKEEVIRIPGQPAWTPRHAKAYPPRGTRVLWNINEPGPNQLSPTAKTSDVHLSAKQA